MLPPSLAESKKKKRGGNGLIIARVIPIPRPQLARRCDVVSEGTFMQQLYTSHAAKINLS